MKSLFLILFFIILSAAGLHAQQFNFNDYIPASPKSPNAAALGQYGDVPVSLYTGVPDIQIPVYEIKVGKVSIPISLSYHAGGVKVEDYPSWVGTGWVLNAGGVINRQQRGILDERMIDNYANYQTQATDILNSSVTNSLGVDDSSAPKVSSNAMFQNNYDTESDMFTCIFPGGNSKFYLDVAGNVHNIPANKLQIQALGRIVPDAAARNYCFKQWIVQDNQGTKYIYGALGAANNYEVVTSESYYTTQFLPESTINSWYLAEIDLTNGQKINFNYETYNYSTPVSGSPTVFNALQISVGSNQVNFLNFTVALRLSNITYPGGKVEFVAGGYRADLPMDKVLDKINIYNQVNGNYGLLKSFKMITNNPENVTPAPLYDNSNSFRLNLQSVEMYDKNQAKTGSYSFDYDQSTPSLPRNSVQDYWGYYRGVAAVDASVYFLPNSATAQKLFSTSRRPANSTYSQFDILKKITYPTGGYSMFTYENNQAVPNNSAISYNLGGFIADPVVHQTEFDLSNDNTNSASGFGPEFTVGSITSETTSLVTIRELANDGSGCPVLTQCFSNNLWRKNTDGTWTNLGGGNSQLVSNTTYKIQIVWHTSNQGVAYANYSWVESPVISPADVNYVTLGSLRIKKIQSFDPVTNGSINKSYQYLKDDGSCSGSISSLPIFFYYFPQVDVDKVHYRNVLTTTSQNQSPLFSAIGSDIGYSSVIEYDDDNGTLGKTAYKYTSNDTSIPGGYVDDGVAASFNFPFPPVTSYEWRRGNLLSKYSYVNKNGSFQPVSKTDNTYQFFGASDANYQLNTNIKIFQSEYTVFGQVDPNYFYVYLHDYVKYPTVSEAYFTLNSTQQVFDSQNYTSSIISTVTNNFDHVSLENSGSTASKSNGGSSTQQVQYAGDYNSSSATDDAALGIKNLVTMNMVKSPVERLTVVQGPSGQSFVTGGNLFIYYKDKPRIYKYYKLNVTIPIPIASFTASVINSSGQFTYDSRYELISSIDFYTPLLNVGQVTQNTTQLRAYQWGYNEQYLVAEATNAKNNDIFYDSFEEGDGTSIVDDAKTGHYSYTGSYSKALTGLDNGTYTLSYWQKSGTTWTLQTTAVTVSTGVYTISLNMQVDDVRFYPALAQMTTYTYDPLVGMTSSTDAKGEVTYYEYDGFQRLMNVRDKDKNIIKHMDYHYQGQ